MKKYSVLLVEDDEFLSRVLKQVLERQDMEIDIAEDGAVALRKVNERKYDGIISDIDMPVCDGIEFIKKLRKTKDYTPVLFYSGRAEDDETKVVNSFGAEGIISKQNVKLVGPKITEMIRIHKIQKAQGEDTLSNQLLREFEELVHNSL